MSLGTMNCAIRLWMHGSDAAAMHSSGYSPQSLARCRTAALRKLCERLLVFALRFFTPMDSLACYSRRGAPAGPSVTNTLVLSYRAATPNVSHCAGGLPRRFCLEGGIPL